MTSLVTPYSEVPNVLAQVTQPEDFYPEAPWIENQKAGRTKWRSEYTNLMPQTTLHKAEIIDIFSWYWTETHLPDEVEATNGTEKQKEAERVATYKSEEMLSDQGKEYWQQEKNGRGTKDTWACFGVRVSHDKDNYAFQGGPGFQEFNPYSGIKYTTQDKKEWAWVEPPKEKVAASTPETPTTTDPQEEKTKVTPTVEEPKYVYGVVGGDDGGDDEEPASTWDPQKHRIWITIDIPATRGPDGKVIPGALEGGYLELDYAVKGGKDFASTDGAFGKVKYDEKNSSVGPGYFSLEADVSMEETYPENDPAKNPWKVRDYPWLNGDYDAHLTATVCRKFELPGFPTMGYMGDDWDNNYNFKYWYEFSDTVKDADPNNAVAPNSAWPAKVGSKIVAQMLVFRKAFIVDPTPRKAASATALITSWTLLAGAYLLF